MRVLDLAGVAVKKAACRECSDVPSALSHGLAAGQGEHRLCMHGGTSSREQSWWPWQLLPALQGTRASASLEPLLSPSQQ